MCHANTHKCVGCKETTNCIWVTLADKSGSYWECINCWNARQEKSRLHKCDLCNTKLEKNALLNLKSDFFNGLACLECFMSLEEEGEVQVKGGMDEIRKVEKINCDIIMGKINENQNRLGVAYDELDD